MKRTFLILTRTLTLTLIFSVLPALLSAQSELRIEVPGVVLAGVPFTIAVQPVTPEGGVVSRYDRQLSVTGLSEGSFDGLSIARAVVGTTGRHTVRVQDGTLSAEVELRAIPAFLSLLPPLIAIAFALIFRQVIVSLIAGIWLAAVFIHDYNIVAGFLDVLTKFVINAVTTTSQAQILVFSLLFGGMVGVITKNGGARGIADLVTRFAKGAKGGQLSVMVMALVMFFDDYANVLVRGNLMRPITDKLRISREKLSFLVDTGAASVASTAIVSTWIGYEIGLIAPGLELIGSSEDAFSMFIRTIPYRFYPLLALIFAFMISATDRDFGPMLKAEKRARHEGKVQRDGAEPATETFDDEEDAKRPSSSLNGLAPIVSILVVALSGIYITGVWALDDASSASLKDIAGASDSYVALLWASLAGCTVAIVLAVGRRVLTLSQAFAAWIQGMKSMMMAVVILVLAWCIGAATTELQAASYLVQVLEGALHPAWLPVLTFVIAAAMAFATGSSWATMAIMMPLVIPLADALSRNAGLAPERVDTLLVGVISSVLAGAVFGDHCSPISDTTILSSMASAADHIDHVRTQLPYALLVAVVGMLVGDIPTAYGLSPWISLVLGSGILLAVLFFYGKPVGTPRRQGEAA